MLRAAFSLLNETRLVFLVSILFIAMCVIYAMFITKTLFMLNNEMLATAYSGDVIDGRSVISHLNVCDLAPGRHQFYFCPLTMATGQHWYIPVTVFQGKQPRKRVMITSGVHGDEINGIIAAQQLMRKLENETLAGTVIIVSGINVPGILAGSRDFIPTDPDSSPANLNRLFPGDIASLQAASRYVAALWQHLLLPNADLALDLHTQTRGADYPLYVFADYRIPQCIAMARRIQPDAILDDPGDAGVLETVWNQAQIPCITIEVGSGKRYQADMVDRTVLGILAILYDAGMVQQQPIIAECPCVEGRSTATVRATLGGYVLPQVVLGAQVAEGDLVAIQWDAFGNETQRYYAPNTGYVLSINSDPLREAGSMLVRILLPASMD